MIPSLLGQPALSNEKPTDLFAYLSIEDTKEQDSVSKPMRGQIRKCNLTASRLIGGLILKEVQFGGTFFFCALSYCTSKYLGVLRIDLTLWNET